MLSCLFLNDINNDVQSSNKNSMVNKAFQIRGTNDFVSSGVRRKLESGAASEALCFTHIFRRITYTRNRQRQKNDGPGLFARHQSYREEHMAGAKSACPMLILTLNRKQDLPTKPLRQLQLSILDQRVR